ncbi:gamma-glutamyl phosphate reductase [Atractiella rhizophila]|nr:gamma-glutamyl phosphate reductase [Atractiella rhizophila]
METARAAKQAFLSTNGLSNEERVSALGNMRAVLEKAKDEVLQANAKDLEAAKGLVDSGKMSSAMLKRLDLQSKPDKYDSMLQGITDVANLPDPLGQVTYASKLDEGLNLYRASCPIGVILCIFESRPEVMVNIASLAIKSGNAAILKGGKESIHTQTVVSRLIQEALSNTSIPRTYIQAVSTREEISSLLDQDEYIDLVIPRGSGELVKHIQNNTKIPVMGHADGLCHVFLDESADETKAIRVTVDSKAGSPATCNAAETLLLHSSLLGTLWPKVASALTSAGVKLLCDPPSLSAIASSSVPPELLAASSYPTTYTIEHLSLTLSVLTVSNVQEAIKHINAFGSGHTDSIVTEDEDSVKAFTKGVDSAGVFVNASTWFADGFRYGFGTEVGIATGKTHARGPVGLEGLVIYRYLLRSMAKEGHVVSEFGIGEGKKTYLHQKIQTDRVPF